MFNQCINERHAKYTPNIRLDLKLTRTDKKKRETPAADFYPEIRAKKQSDSTALSISPVALFLQEAVRQVAAVQPRNTEDAAS